MRDVRTGGSDPAVPSVTQNSKTVANALTILNALAAESPASALDVSRATGISRTAAHRLLRTLEEGEFVRRVGSRYRLGFALLRLSDSIENDIRAASGQGLEELAAEFSGTSVLVVPEGTEAIVIDQRVNQDTVAQIKYPLGFRSALNQGGHGLAILAFSPPSVVAAVMATLVDVASREELAMTLDKIRRSGYAFTSNVLKTAASGLAVPVLDRHDHAIASIGIVTTLAEFPDQAVVAQEAKRVASHIREQLVL